MLLTPSPSPSRSGGRPGLTLIEIVITMGLLSVLTAVLVNSFIGMRKSQGATITSNLLKVGGQRAMKSMYQELSQARMIVAGAKGDASPTLARQLYERLDKTNTTTNALFPIADLAFPTVNSIGAFGVTGITTGKLDQATVGNVLIYVVHDGDVKLSTNNVFYDDKGSNVNMGTKPYVLPRYRIVAYYPVKVPLPDGAAPIKPGSNYSMQLVRWVSQPLLDKADVDTVFSALTFPWGTSISGVINVFSNVFGTGAGQQVGVWDFDAAPSSAFRYSPSVTFTLIPLDLGFTFGPRPGTQLVPREMEQYVGRPNLDGYAQPSLSFNTSTAFAPGDDTFKVPAFADPNGVGDKPYGFEVAIAGPPGARQVLTRLSLVARLNAGGNIFAMSHQEVVRVNAQ